MDICNVNFFSDALGKYSSLTAFIPRVRGKARRRREFPVMYLLHGHSDDYSAWGRFSRLEKYVQEYGIAVITPDASTSYYINSPMGRFEDHIINDVIGFSESTFPVSNKRGGRAIAGLSMGGFGALSLGMKNPSKFAAIGAHSSAVYPQRFIASRPAAKVLAADMLKSRNCLKTLSRQLMKKRSRPAIRIDCGSDDFLYEDNVAFDAYLTKIGIRHEFHVFDGCHSWDYWEEHIPQTFEFVKAALK